MPYKDPEKEKAFRKRQREKRKEYTKEYHKRHKEHLDHLRRLRHVKVKYNLDAEDYLHMINEQENRCAICRCHETWKNPQGDVRPLSVDHDHATGKVRALLCVRCNALLGHAQDSPERLQAAIHYLKRYKEE